MKPSTKIILLTLLCIACAACSSDEQQIRRVAQKYLNATGNYRIDEAMPYASQVTRETSLPFMRDVIIPITDSNYIKNNQPATIVIDSVHVLCTDTATVNYTKTTPIRVLKATLMLVKEDGKWLAYAPVDVPQLPVAEQEDNNNTTAAQ